MYEIGNIFNKDVPKLSLRQRRLVLGCLLGRGTIIKPPGNRGCYFCIHQSKREDINVLAYKAAELKQFGRATAIIEDANSVKWYSTTSVIWDELYELCYKNGKKELNMRWLDDLSSLSFMIWFMDLARGKELLSLNVGKFLKQKDLLCEYFDQIGIPATINDKRLDFDATSTEKFLKVIYQDTPEYLLYRLQSY